LVGAPPLPPDELEPELKKGLLSWKSNEMVRHFSQYRVYELMIRSARLLMGMTGCAFELPTESMGKGLR